MKNISKFIAIALFMIGATNLLNAQLAIGGRVGTNFAWSELEEKIDGNWKTDNTDIIPRLTFGLIAEISTGKHFAVQPEVNFIQKGYKTETLVITTTQKQKVILNYVEVPILLKGKFGSNTLQINVLAGPTFGYTFEGTSEIDDLKKNIDFSNDKIKKADIGAAAGLGITFGGFFADARLGWGFTNLDDSSNSDNINWHTRGVNIGAGYLFHF